MSSLPIEVGRPAVTVGGHSCRQGINIGRYRCLPRGASSGDALWTTYEKSGARFPLACGASEAGVDRKGVDAVANAEIAQRITSAGYPTSRQPLGATEKGQAQARCGAETRKGSSWRSAPPPMYRSRSRLHYFACATSRRANAGRRAISDNRTKT